MVCRATSRRPTWQPSHIRAPPPPCGAGGGCNQQKTHVVNTDLSAVQRNAMGVAHGEDVAAGRRRRRRGVREGHGGAGLTGLHTRQQAATARAKTLRQHHLQEARLQAAKDGKAAGVGHTSGGVTEEGGLRHAGAGAGGGEGGEDAITHDLRNVHGSWELTCCLGRRRAGGKEE